MESVTSGLGACTNDISTVRRGIHSSIGRVFSEMVFYFSLAPCVKKDVLFPPCIGELTVLFKTIFTVVYRFTLASSKVILRASSHSSTRFFYFEVLLKGIYRFDLPNILAYSSIFKTIQFNIQDVTRALAGSLFSLFWSADNMFAL
jgi:hypothetical protein